MPSSREKAPGLTFNRFIEEGSCSFYGAPVAIIVVIDKLFPAIRYLDVGLAVSYLLLAAQAKNLATCPIGLIAAYNDDISQMLSISEDKEILLGISLGYADENSPANAFRTGRADLKEIVTSGHANWMLKILHKKLTAFNIVNPSCGLFSKYTMAIHG